MAAGGAERVMSYLLPHLMEKGEKVVLVLMNDTFDYKIPEGLPVFFIEKSKGDEPGFWKLLKLPWLALKYARFLKKEGITHSFSLLTRPCLLNIMASKITKHKYKVIISERNYPSLQYGKPNLQSKINALLVKFFYPKADLVISNANASAKDLVANFGIKPSKMKVVFNPIDFKSIQELESVTKFDGSYFNLVSVGRLQPVKNHEFLINAIKDIDNVRLYIIGEGELKLKLQNQIKKLKLEDRVYLLGYKSKPFRYIKNADLFVFGSLHEGFPNVLLEAMACGLPILSTNCKSGPDEIMELDKVHMDDIMFTKYGILTPIENLALFRKGLHYMIENENYLKECAANTLERIKYFKKEPILEQYRSYIFD